MELSVSDWSTEHKISYLQSINARESGMCQLRKVRTQQVITGAVGCFDRSDQWAQCLTKPKSLRTQLPQLIQKAIALGNSVADSISDPWEEVAELSELPKDTATHRWLR